MKIEIINSQLIKIKLIEVGQNMNVFELAISRKEVLRYLGDKGQALDENLESI
ncbi:hypothetical protein [Clostridium saccharoperbutylacetonicum]|uniref:hypothetical protein n=1 Tax=Clostridium saccharoperbutylacetonicum TaxID=36745 RepID=UPI0039E96BC7